MRITNCEDPHYAVFPSLLLLPPSPTQTASSVSCSQIPLTYILSLMSEIKFHTHTEQQTQL
jgi:hypothetical protein